MSPQQPKPQKKARSKVGCQLSVSIVVLVVSSCSILLVFVRRASAGADASFPVKEKS